MMSKWHQFGVRLMSLSLITAPVIISASEAHASEAGTAKFCGSASVRPRWTGSAQASSSSEGRMSDQAVADYKATHDSEASQIAKLRVDATRQEDAKRTELASVHRRQPSAKCDAQRIAPAYTSGSGYAYISWMVQYGQTRSNYCGPATVAEMSATVPGPSLVGLNQDAVASYMGTDSTGTDVQEMVNGLNHYVGQPDFGWNFYSFVWMDYNPTPAQRSTFLNNLQIDVQYNSPVAGDAWEAAGGPHLPGHPVNQEIFHWFEIGGWNTNTGQVWFADSATTVWSGVPAYSVYSTHTIGTILGGRGYIW